MKIGINARFLLVANRTGVQRAAYNLVKTLVEIDRKNQYFLFTGHSELNNPDWDYENVTVVTSNIREGENMLNHFWEQFTLPRLAKRYNVDILHSPANMAPLLYRGKSVVHIHDLCFVVNPQWYSFSFRTLYNLLIPRLARRAAKVITNSNNSRNDLLQFCNLASERVSFVYWAVDDIFVKPILPAPSLGRAQANDSTASESLAPGALAKPEGSPWSNGDYILYVGSFDPRKNIRTLVEAYENMRNNKPELKHKLILIGGESPLFGDVRLNIKTYKDDVVFKGFVEDNLLRDFYRHASLVVYPSLYEGFGLPPLEAMASGTPVVTSRTSSIPEVVGDAAVMVSPYDVDELAFQMGRVLEDPELRADLIAKGYAQVKRFNWYRVARNTLAVYYEVFNSSSDPAGRTQEFVPFDVWRELVNVEEQMVKSH